MRDFGSSSVRHFYYLGVICLLFSPLYAQNDKLIFKHYGLQEGLTDLSVGSMVQDSQGFIWMGTLNGVSRFDGYEFKTYEHIPGDSFSLSTNSIGDIFIDSRGQMWVGTLGKGLNYYDAELDHFIRLVHEPTDSNSIGNNYINDIFEDSRHNLWIATQGGLNRLADWNEENFAASFQHYPDLKYPGITCLAEFPKGTLWLGTARNGLIHMDLNGDQVHYIKNEKKGASPILASNLIKRFFVEDDQDMWVCSFGGLSHVRPTSSNTFTLRPFIFNKNDSLGLPHPNITSMAKPYPDEYWLGTFNGGLIRMKTQTNRQLEFQRVKKSENQANGLASDLINEFFMDRDGNLWLGTDHGVNMISLSYIIKNRKAFNHLHIPQQKDQNLRDVLSFFEDEHQNLWVGTYGNGIWVFHFASQSWQRIRTSRSSEQKLSNSIVTTITQDKAGIFWVGTFGGLNRMEVEWKEGKPIASIQWFLPDPQDSLSLSNKHIFAVKDEDSILWIGTRGGGLNKFDKKSQTFAAFTQQADDAHSISNNYIWSIEKDGQGRLWMATDGGLNIYDPQTAQFSSFTHDPGDPKSLSNNFNNVVFKDSRNRMWIGHYGTGIDVIQAEKIDHSPPSFTHIRAKNGLVNEKIYGILEDRLGQIWITTPQGLCRINAPNWDLPAPPPLEAFQSFFKEDGLQENEFNSGAQLLGKTGEIFLGGINGFNRFYPEDIARNTRKPRVVISNITIQNQDVQPNRPLQTGSFPLDKNPNAGGSLRLTHKDLILTIEYAALNFIFPEKNQYAFKLEGFDQDWVYAGNQRSATYTKLREGNYTFKVKASNNDGAWNEKATQLNIHVSPPPWRSWWAYCLYIFAAFGLIYSLFRLRLRQKEMQLETLWRINQAKVEERERVRKNAAADFHDELGNKTTKISLFVELAKRQAQMGMDIESFLDQINAHTRQLSEGIRDFIWVLDPEQDSLYKVINRAKEFGDELFDHTLTNFQVKGLDSIQQDLILPVETRRHLLMIIKEALHNVLKYARASECVLSLKTDQKLLEIMIKDNGQGFDVSRVKKGYGLGNMADRAQKIGADFQVSSQSGTGSTISLFMEYPK